MDIGPTELIIILIIVVLVFGVGRVGKLGGELGNAIREFRQGLNGDKDKQQHPDPTQPLPFLHAPQFAGSFPLALSARGHMLASSATRNS